MVPQCFSLSFIVCHVFYILGLSLSTRHIFFISGFFLVVCFLTIARNFRIPRGVLIPRLKSTALIVNSYTSNKWFYLWLCFHLYYFLIIEIRLLFFVCKGGESILLHFIQDSPGDHVPLEDISKTLGISAQVKAGQMPVVRSFRSETYFTQWLFSSVVVALFSLSIVYLFIISQPSDVMM